MVHEEHTKPLLKLRSYFIVSYLLKYAMAIFLFKAFQNLLPVNIYHVGL